MLNCFQSFIGMARIGLIHIQNCFLSTVSWFLGSRGQVTLYTDTGFCIKSLRQGGLRDEIITGIPVRPDSKLFFHIDHCFTTMLSNVTNDTYLLVF